MISIKTNVVRIVIDLIMNRQNHSEKSQEKRNKEDTERHIDGSVISKLEEIKTTLNGLARRDLMTGISFFQEGLECLFEVLGVEAHIKKNSVSKTKDSIKLSSEKAVKGRLPETYNKRTDSFEVKVKDNTAKFLSQAKTNFELAEKKAKLASDSESLSTQNRILALKLFMASAVLENIDEPSNSLEQCSACLRQLHSFPVVSKIFKIQPQRRVTATLKPLIKKQRENVIDTICQMNHVVFMVTLLSGGKPLFWPSINNGACHAINSLGEQNFTNKLQELKTVSYGRVWSFGEEDGKLLLDYPVDITTNSRGEFIVADISDIKVFSESGKFLSSYFPCNGDVTTEQRFRPISIASCKNGRMYVLSKITVKDNSIQWLGVYVLDSHFNTCFRFPVRKGFKNAKAIVLNNYEQICILGEKDGVKLVDVYQNKGQYNHSFGAGILENPLDITKANEGLVMVLDKGKHSVLVFDQKGVHVKQFRIQGEIEGALAFSHAINLFAVTTIDRDTEQGEVDVYTMEGAYLHTVHLETWDNPGLCGASVTIDGRFVVTSKLDCEVYVL